MYTAVPGLPTNEDAAPTATIGAAHPSLRVRRRTRTEAIGHPLPGRGCQGPGLPIARDACAHTNAPPTNTQRRWTVHAPPTARSVVDR